MKRVEINLGWESRKPSTVKKPVLKDFMNKQIATQPKLTTNKTIKK